MFEWSVVRAVSQATRLVVISRKKKIKMDSWITAVSR